jgi:hypothetical protein
MAIEAGNGMSASEWPGAARPASWFLSPEAPLDDENAEADDLTAAPQVPQEPSAWRYSGVSWEGGARVSWGGGAPVNEVAHDPARPDWPRPGEAAWRPPVETAWPQPAESAWPHPAEEAAWPQPAEEAAWPQPAEEDAWPQPPEEAAWPQPAGRHQAPPGFGTVLGAPVVADAPPRYPVSPPRPPAPDHGSNAWTPRQLTYPELPSTPIRRRTRRRVTPMTFVRLGLPVVVLAGVAAVAMMMLTGHTRATLSDRGNQTAPAASGQSPAASVTPSEFSQVNVAGDGNTVVAVGSQDSATPSFRVSDDGGLAWTTAAITSQAGPVNGHQATMVAGGAGGWVGLGPNAIWTSANGRTWTLVSAHGLAAPGITITGLIKDSWGYLASGTSASSGAGLVWTSPNGLTWHQHTAAQFGLVDTHGEMVFAMTDAATDWNVTLVAGSAHLDGKTCAYIWRSLDLGASWRTVVVPQTHGASWSFAGLAGDAGNFIAVRPGVSAGGVPEAVVYTSPDAINWHFATTITGTAGFTPQQVTGGAGRFVITGHDRQGNEIAYTSTDSGAAWTPSDGFGVLPAA